MVRYKVLHEIRELEKREYCSEERGVEEEGWRGEKGDYVPID